MEILMISPQFRPIVGGYERACERLAIALVQRGHAVTVCAERRENAWPTQESIDGVRVQRWWCMWKSGRHVLTSVLGLTAYLLRHGRRFQVWHVHQYGMHAALALILGRILRRPVVLKLTSSSTMGLAQTLAAGLLPRLTAALHRRVDAVVALTRETAVEAKRFGIPPARIHVLGNGVDTQAYCPVAEPVRKRLRESLELPARSLVISVGRLSPEKDISGLLQAWALARPGMDGEWALVIVGDGPLREQLEAEAKGLAIEASVWFVGLQANTAHWLAAASIYVLSSNREGLSNTMLEAMATGLPMVVTRVSGTTELVEETGSGQVVPIGDAGALSAALLKLASSQRLRQEMGARGRRIIEDRYAVSAVAEMHEALYEQLVRRAGAHRPLPNESC